MQKYICYRQYLRVNTRGPGVAVVLQNLSGRGIILEPYTEVGMVTAANRVPSVQIPDLQDGKENEKVQSKAAQADLHKGEIRQEETDPEDILQKIDLSGIVD